MPRFRDLRLKRQRRRAPRRLRSKKSNLKGFSAVQTRSLLAAIGRSDETKYYAKDLLINFGLDPAIHTPATPATGMVGDMVPLVPPIVAGTGESQRIGRKVAPVKCRADISVAFTQKNVGDSTAPPSASWANQVYVVMYVLRSKVYKNWSEFANSTQWQRLLDNGDSTSTSFGYQPGGTTVWASNTTDLMKPIETSEFTLLRKRVVKLTKNTGTVDNGPLPSVPNLATTSYRGSFTYKLPTLQYDDTNTTMGGYPTNSCVFLALAFCYADNLSTYVLGEGGAPAQIDPIVCATVRNHVWYKDT